MAASSTVTYDDGSDGAVPARRGSLSRVLADWISASDGSCVIAVRKVVGELVKIQTDPAPGGAAPTDNYDIAITDEEGVDILANASADVQNRDTANSEEVYPTLKDKAGTGNIAAFPVVCSPLTITISNAGDTKGGQVILYIRN